MTSINFYERTALIKRIENNLNQINQRYFDKSHVILSVTDNGDYLTVKKQGVYLADYDTQKLFDALENFIEEVRELLSFPYDLWDYLDYCKYTPEDQNSDNLSKLVEELETKNEILEKKNQELEQSKEYNEAWIDNLKQRVHDLECAVYLLQQENKQLKNNQAETKPEPQPETKLEPKPTTKKQPKFKLPENFADYQQECDDLVNELSCFYNIKKGKWEKDILQFILTPVKSTTPPYPNKWKAGLYLQPGEWTWTIDKVSMSDPDEWKEHFMNVYDFVDSSGIEIS
jgi:hypothetical protein